MSKLPLIARKNIKDQEPKLKEHTDAIKEALGLGPDVTLDAQFAEINEWCAKNGYENRPADIVDWVLGGLLSNIKNHFAEETAKNSLNAAWTTGNLKVVIAPRPKGKSGYHATSLENGDLTITCYSEGAASNVDYVGSDLLAQLKDDSGLSVKASQNVQQYKEDRETFASETKDILGLPADVTVEIEWGPWFQFYDKLGYEDRGGEVLKWFLDALKRNFENNFKDKDLEKAALHSSWSTGVIKVSAREKNKKDKESYYTTFFENGDLVLEAFSCSNVDYCGANLFDLLVDPETNLPLKSAVNFKATQEKRQEMCEAIKESVGLASDVTIEMDLSAVDADAKVNGYDFRGGDVIEWIVDGLKSKLSSICAEELTKEAIAEVWTTGVIKIERGTDKQKHYHCCAFTNGDLVITYKPKSMASNVSYVGQDIEEQL